MAAAHPSSLLCHWDGSSYMGLLISVLISLPRDTIHSAQVALYAFVIVHVHLCLRKPRLQLKTFQVVHFA